MYDKQVRSLDYEATINDLGKLPDIQDLPKNTLSAIAQYVAFNRYAKKMSNDFDISQYNLNEIVSGFIGSYDSPSTIRTYNKALSEYFDYCNKIEISPLQANNKTAIDYIDILKKSALSGGSIKLKISCLKAFYSFLCELDPVVFSPIFNKKKLPPVKPVNTKKFYTKDITSNYLASVSQDINKIIQAVSAKKTKNAKNILFALIVMKNTGLRVGAFNASLNFELDNKIYSGVSKGKTIKGLISDNCINELNKYGFRSVPDYSLITTNNLTRLITGLIQTLKRQNIISRLYTPHDFRHYFAINDYSQHHDIYRLSKLLNHSNILITENYLNGLNLFV